MSDLVFFQEAHLPSFLDQKKPVVTSHFFHHSLQKALAEVKSILPKHSIIMRSLIISDVK